MLRRAALSSLLVAALTHHQHGVLAQPYAGCTTSSYYDDPGLVASWRASSGAALRAMLRTHLVARHFVIPYSSHTRVDVWDALEVLDATPGDPENVTLVYSLRSVPKGQHVDASGWNREHVWPKSYGVGYTGPDFTDVHHLRAVDWNVNSARNNKYFGNCDEAAAGSTCTSPAHREAAPSTADSSDEFRPPTTQRGDVARAMFYMAARYDGTETNTENLSLSDCPCQYTWTMGKLGDLLTWHTADPVDDVERARTEGVCTGYQGSRNPFVDYPDLVALVGLANQGLVHLSSDEVGVEE